MINTINKYNILYSLILIILPVFILYFISPLLSKIIVATLSDPYIVRQNRKPMLQSISNHVPYDEIVEIITKDEDAFLGKDQYGRTIIHDLLLESYSDEDILKIIELAIEMGVNINSKSYLWTGGAPIHDAVRLNNIDKLDILIMKGADIHLKNNMGETPMAYALRLNHVSIVNHIKNKYQVDINLDTVVIGDFRRFIYSLIFTGYQRPWAFKIFIVLLLIYLGICLKLFYRWQYNSPKKVYQQK